MTHEIRRGGAIAQVATSQVDGAAAAVSEIASLAARGRYSDAFTLVNSALRATPGDTRLLFAKGSTLLDWGRYRESRGAYEEAERNGLRSIGLYRHLGWACFLAGDLDGAEPYLRRAASAGADDFEAQFCLGVLLRERERDEEAATVLSRAVEIRPGDVEAQVVLGHCHVKLGDPVRAEACYRRAASIDPSNPKAWSNLGLSLRVQDRLREAISAFEKAYELEPNLQGDADSFLNLAVGYADVGQRDDARRVLEDNLAERPSARAHYNYGILLLQQGNLRDGWRHYEFRWAIDDEGFQRARYGKPVWSGQDIRGKSVVLRAEQGIGDTIQFLRYAALLEARGARVLLKAPQGYEALASGVVGLDGVLPAHDTPLDFDFYLPMLGAGAAFGTTLESIPATVPYIRADAERKSRWRVRLGSSKELNIGLVWAGSPAHKRDRYRSMPLEMLGPLFGIDGIRFVSLQKGPATDQIERFAPAADMLNLGPELEDFADTAAVLDQLDLVIGVDTAMIHLAGAMGRPVWALIPTPSDWRWLIDREDSPWYPTMRLFRQPASGNWHSVASQVSAQLAELVSAGTQGLSSGGGLDRSLATSASDVHATAPPSREFSAIVEGRHGIVQYLPEPATIATSLQLYGEYLQELIDVLRPLVGASDTIIEYGAGCGAHALALAALCNHVVAYEEDLIARRVLGQNLRANGVRNVTALPGSIVAPLAAAQGCPSVDALGLEQLAMIKVSEYASAPDVIRGAEGTLWRLRPAIVAAVTDEVRLTTLRDQIVSFGYRCWRIDTPMFNAANFNRRDENVFGNRSAMTLLALPEELDVELPSACKEIR